MILRELFLFLQANSNTDHLRKYLFSNDWIIIDEKMVKDIKNGKQLFLPYQGNRILLMNGDEALAIYEYVDNIYKMKRGLF